jgi:O-antigen/teichoic acid export membrane protein
MKAMSNAGVMLACRVLADSLNVVLFVLVSRILGPAGVGVYSYGFAVAGFVWAATVLGIEDYGVREYQRTAPAQRSALIGDLLGLQLTVAVIAFVAVGIYLQITPSDQQTTMVVWALVVHQVCSAIGVTLFVPAMAEQRMAQPAVTALVTRSLAFGGASVLLAIQAAPLSVAMLAFPLTAVVYVGAAVRSARSFLGSVAPHFAWPAIRGAVLSMWSFAAVEMLGQLLARISVIVLTLRLGGDTTGVYATGLKLIEVAFLPLWFLTIAAYPSLCQHFISNQPQFKMLGTQLTWITVAFTAAVSVGLYVVVPILLVPVFGESFAGTQPIIALMALLAAVYGLEITLGRILFASNLNRRRAAAVGIGAVVCTVLNFVLIPMLAVRGAIYATTVAYALVIAICLAALKGTVAKLRTTSASPS